MTSRTMSRWRTWTPGRGMLAFVMRSLVVFRKYTAHRALSCVNNFCTCVRRQIKSMMVPKDAEAYRCRVGDVRSNVRNDCSQVHVVGRSKVAASRNLLDAIVGPNHNESFVRLGWGVEIILIQWNFRVCLHILGIQEGKMGIRRPRRVVVRESTEEQFCKETAVRAVVLVVLDIVVTPCCKVES